MRENSRLTPQVLKHFVSAIKESAQQARRARQKLLLELVNIELPSRLSQLVEQFEGATDENSDVKSRALSEIATVELPQRLNRLLGQFDPNPNPRQVHDAQAQLRSIWRDASHPTKTPTIKIWLARAWAVSIRQAMNPADQDDFRLKTPLVPNWGTGQLEFVPTNFYGQLATAVLENWVKFRVCVNPDCPARFFFAKRSTSKVCERGDCSKYAQQQHALKWWKENRQKKGGKK